MDTSSDKLFVQKIARVCELLDGLSMDESRISGIARNSTDLAEISLLLQQAEELEDELSHEVQGLNITFYKVSQIFKNFEKLLNNSSYRRKVPASNFYLIEDRQAFYQDEQSIFFNNYLKIIELYKFLEAKADHINTDVGQHSLVFLNNRKLLLTDEYAINDLIELKNLELLISKFSNDDSNHGVSNKEKDQIL